MNIEKEIDKNLKVMENKVTNSIDKLCIGNINEYKPCKKMIENYSGEKSREFRERLLGLIPYLDFYN